MLITVRAFKPINTLKTVNWWPMAWLQLNFKFYTVSITCQLQPNKTNCFHLEGNDFSGENGLIAMTAKTSIDD